MRFSLFLMALLAFSSAHARTTLTIVGTGDGIDLMRALGNSYASEQKNPEVAIPPSIGSGGGIGAVGAGSAVIGRVARKLKPEEIAHGLIYVPVAKIPTVIFINKNLKIQNLTSAQISDIYQGKIRNWRELGGVDMKIRIVRREDSDSSLDALRKSMTGWKDLKITERSKTAVSTQEAIETVRDIPGTIGFGPYSSQLENHVNVLAIDGMKPLDPNYPSNVELGLIYKQDTVTNDVHNFIKFSQGKKSHELISSFGALPVVK